MNSNAAVKFYDLNPATAQFLDEVVEGLNSKPRYISPKFFYDKEGSELFDAICGTQEYYPTRTEIGIIRDNLDEIVEYIDEGCLLIEPGSGASIKVRELLEPLEPHAYLPMDISGTYLKGVAQELSEEYPGIQVHAVCVDYTVPFDLPYRPQGRKRIAFYPGSSIGNFDPYAAVKFLANIARIVGPGGGLLIGVDLRKDHEVLNRAYNDTQGFTEAFNKNLLVHINRELNADFDIDRFDHLAYFNDEQSRIEMHLVSNTKQTVEIEGHVFNFAPQEKIHTENSYKYTVESFQELAKHAGFRSVKVWTDPQAYFSLHYMEVEDV